MTDIKPSTGSCLCGLVQIEVENMNPNVGACHCGMCRKWGGAPFMEVNCGSKVSFAGEEHITVFSSSNWADRGFCAKCGSHLFYRLKSSQEYMVSVGLFGNDDRLVFDNQVFIDEKPSFYSFSNTTNDMTGAEIFAKFAHTSK
ncbi:MAG: GFA family protein [Gammaproteobacteria bacterium]|nr:GFA family protein [Gammaproteobacteria bacterium]